MIASLIHAQGPSHTTAGPLNSNSGQEIMTPLSSEGVLLSLKHLNGSINLSNRKLAVHQGWGGGGGGGGGTLSKQEVKSVEASCFG